MWQSVLVLIIVILSYAFRIYQHRRKNRKVPGDTRSPWVFKLVEQRRFHDIAARYRKEAQGRETKVNRINLLGLASLYDHDAPTAIDCFQKAVAGAVGESEMTIRDNLAVAYLQRGWYQAAYDLMEKSRETGKVVILTYTFTLLMNGQTEEAKEFYKLNPVSSGAAPAMDALLNFDAHKPETLDEARKVVDNPYLWLYTPFLPELFRRWDVEVFFNRENRYELLTQHCQSLIQALSEQAFASPLVRYMRSLLVSVSGKIQTYEGFTQLYGLYNGLDELAQEMPLAEEVKAECAVFWQRVHYIINHLFNPHHFQWHTAEEWLTTQKPSDADEVRTTTDRCDLYIVSSLGRGIRILRQFDPYPRLYAEFISLEDAELTKRKVSPLVDIVQEDQTLNFVVEPLIFSFVYDVHQVTRENIHDTMIRLPDKYRPWLETLMAGEEAAPTSSPKTITSPQN